MYNKSLLAILFVFSFTCILLGQNRLEETFYDYEILAIDSKAEVSRTQTGFFETKIDAPLKGLSWTLDLRVSNIISDDYVVRIQTDDEILIREGTSAVPTQGYIKGNADSRVSLTFSDGFIYGFIEDGINTYYIEPLSYFDNNAKHDEFIFYSQSDLKPQAEKTCGTDMKLHAVHDKGTQTNQGSRVGECFEVDWAIANDYLMYQQYGNTAGVENHAIGVANNVQTNYDDEFADELQLVIPGQYVVEVSGQDPWTNDTDAGTLLTDFRTWGPGGFGFDHDIGSLWTDRDFDGSTIGIAYVGVVCGGSRYNCLQDFTNTASFKRVMVSHELGHNFNASHDASGSSTIMAPSVNNTNNWSTTSINSINNHIATRTCLADCSGSNPSPVADFTFIQFSDCAIAEVEFLDNSSGNNLEYEWSFPGGTPSSSTEQNPIISFPLAEVYDVSLTVTNSGGQDTYTEIGAVVVTDVPDISFGFDINEYTVDFINFTTGATSYDWDFGDGFTSVADSPSHTYEEDGTYFVTLIAENQCGSVQQDELITITTLPTPDFDHTNPTGCEGHTVSFFNMSSDNTQNIQWTFEGGDPDLSGDDNITVTYATAGVYDVTLTAYNTQGEVDKLEADLVEIFEAPQANFTYTINENSVICSNSSTNAGSFIWNFGDGNTSTETNPTHTYTDEGTYTITLTASGSSECDDDIATETIQITLLPIASFNVVAGITSGCNPLQVQFNNTSGNSPTSYMWTFEGGTPSTSSEQNPTVTYNDVGTFDVQLVATNSNGSDETVMIDFIDVSTAPISASIEETSDDLSFTFTGTATYGESYTWNFGDGNTGIGNTISHTYEMDGTYEVMVTVSNDCGETTATTNVQAYSDVTAGFSYNQSLICVENTVQFSNMSSDNSETLLWTFEGGTPSTSSEQSPLVTYENTGTFDVTLKVSNPLHTDEEITTDAITVEGNLDPTFEIIENELTLSFDGSASSSVTWDFGDGNTSSEIDPTHTYSEEGIYTIIYTASNSCGSFTEMTEVNLYTQVTAGVLADNMGGCAPHFIMFADNSSDNTTDWSWTFEGGTPSTSTEQNPTVEWQTAGNYNITLVASNPVSSESATMIIEISDVADVSFDSFREELEVTFTNTSVGDATSYSWDFGDGTSSMDENPIHNYAMEGEYEVTLTITNDCGSSMTTQSVIASALPSASYSASGTTGCLPYTVIFTDASSSNVTAWAWSFEGGSPSTSTEQNPSITYNSAGTYDVSLTVTAPAGTDEKIDTDAITIVDVPMADFNYTVDGTLVNFMYDGEEADVSWDFGDGKGASSDKNPSNTYDMNGIYKVIMTATNECGTTTVEQEVVISTVSVDDVDSFSFDIYPNPASGYVVLESTEQTLNVLILSTTGQLVKKQTVSNGNKLDTSELLEGTYIIKVQSTDNKVGYKKLLICK